MLEVAEQQIALHGVEGFQIETAAEAVGVRSPSAFAHLRGREDMAAEVAVRIVGRPGEREDVTLGGVRSPGLYGDRVGPAPPGPLLDLALPAIENWR